MPDDAPMHTAAPATIAEIEAVVRTYLDGLYLGDAERIAAAFHPCAHLYSARDGDVADLPREEWLGLVRTRGSPAAQGLARDDRILMVDVAGPETALVKVACQVPPRFFTDYLMLLRTDAGWRIVSKVFRAEAR